MNNKVSTVGRLFAIISILDDYIDFNRRLSLYSNNKYSKKIEELNRLSQGYSTNDLEAKRFYKDNKRIIDAICNYTSLDVFMYKLDSDYYYNYIIKNRENIDKIELLLNKIKSLGFNYIYFNENNDFTKEEYKYYKNYNCDVISTYLDNMQAILKYDDSVIEYKSSFSNYKIVFEVNNDNFTNNHRAIFLNSLIFDAKRLPDKFNKDTIINKILNLEEINKDKYLAIRSSVDLNVISDDLQKQLDNALIKLNKISKEIDNEEIQRYLEIINTLRQQIEELKSISDAYSSNIEISKEIIDNEQKSYLRRRSIEFYHM